MALAKINGIMPARFTINGRKGWGILAALPRLIA